MCDFPGFIGRFSNLDAFRTGDARGDIVCAADRIEDDYWIGEDAERERVLGKADHLLQFRFRDVEEEPAEALF